MMGGCGLARTDTEQDFVARSCEQHSESSIPQKRRFFEQINEYKIVKEDPVSRRILINSVCIKYCFLLFAGKVIHLQLRELIPLKVRQTMLCLQALLKNEMAKKILTDSIRINCLTISI